MKKFLTKGVLSGMLASTALLATACPPAPGVVLNNPTFSATSVTVNNSQDEVCVIICVNREDEPYVLNVNFRVKIGVPGSASTFVTGSRSNSLSGLGAGDSAALSGAQQATATFAGVQGLDLLDLLDTNNKLEVWGTYVWAMEEDTVGVATAAGNVADILKNALNSTIASTSLPSDAGGIVSLVLDALFDNVGGAFTLLLSNIPLLGLGDDALGGGMYIGIGAKGALGGIIDGSIGTAQIPPIAVPVLALPPDIEHVGLYTLTGAKTFGGQSFSGAGGQHTYNFVTTV